MENVTKHSKTLSNKSSAPINMSSAPCKITVTYSDLVNFPDKQLIF